MPNGDYASVVKKIRPEAENPGNIVDQSGNVLGTHKGIIHYTIGQRRGIGIGGGVSENNAPFFVIGVDAARNEVIVGPKEALARDVIFVRDCNWLVPELSEGINIDLKFRSMMKPVKATLKTSNDNSAQILLADPQYGIAPGQAAVAYLGDRVIGGGWITGTERAR